MTENNQYRFVNVPKEFKDFTIVNYPFSGSWLMETNSTSLNHWKISLPKGFNYKIIGFVDNLNLYNAPSDKNFVLIKRKI